MRPVVDGQPRPRLPEKRIDLLDGIGIDLRLTPQPLVFEESSFEAFIEAGGWIKTIPADLE